MKGTARINPSSSTSNKRLKPTVLLKKKLTVFLDLDETLIHTSTSSRETENSPGCFQINVDGVRLNVKKRPKLEEFLNIASKKYNLVLFTASMENYTRKILEEIDPGDEFFTQCYFRQHCTRVITKTYIMNENMSPQNQKTYYLKDLCRVPAPNLIDAEGETLTRVVLVDNALISFALQPDNGIPITSFMGEDLKDNALLTLLEFLEHVDSYYDVRDYLKDVFRLHRLFLVQKSF